LLKSVLQIFEMSFWEIKCSKTRSAIKWSNQST
jgi:hypothetical protein